MRTLRISATLVWLTVLWVGLWAEASLGNVLAGLAVGLLVLGIARQPAVARMGETTPNIKPLAVIRFILFVLYKLVEANLVLAWEIVTPRNKIRTGVVAIPLRTESDIAMMLVANMVTLTPGTITLDVRGNPPVLYVHVLHLREVEEVRRDLHQLEDLAVRAFGTPAARAQLSALHDPTTDSEEVHGE